MRRFRRAERDDLGFVMDEMKQTKARWVTPVLIGALGIAFTAFVTYAFSRVLESQESERFEFEVAETEAAMERRLELHFSLLRSTAGLLVASEKVSEAEFRTFCERVRLTQAYPGLRGLGYVRRVAAAEAEQFVNARRAEGDPDFRIWPEHQSTEHYPITYLEPSDERNRAALGFDMFTEPTRRAAMERAWETGRASASGRVELVQDPASDKQPAFLIYVPVFRGTTAPEDPAQRRSELRGFAYIPLRAADFFNSLSPTVGRVAFRVYDEQEGPGALLYDTAGVSPVAAAPKFRAERHLDVAGRRWLIQYASLPAFESTRSQLLLPALFFLGAFTSALGAWVIAREVNARMQAQNEVARRRAAEQQQNLLVQELHHRVKNVLTIVAAIGSQTARKARSLTEFRESFTSRIASLASTHDLILQSRKAGSPLAELIQIELGPYVSGAAERYSMHGPPVSLNERQTMSLGMAIHELTTNAVKYGALSDPAGHVEIEWSTQAVDGKRRLDLTWSEHGGPAVSRPEHSGFGSRLIDHTIGRDLGGDVERTFAPDGLRVRIAFVIGEAESAQR